ncbi:hypothetical protein [Roseateles sp.]|uniref:hypothetical protein n=1 Tax=Roseateles sp. TaxID=1971397 RepID=UPI0031DC6088
MPVPMAPEALRESLRISVDALKRRQASEIPETVIDRLVELDWLEWNGGALRLTTTGENIYRKEAAQWRAQSERDASGKPPTAKEIEMAKPNYQFEKRQRELAKQKKKQEKEMEKAQRKAAPTPPEDSSEAKEPTPA